MKKFNKNTDNRVEKDEHLKDVLRCNHCPPNKGENKKTFKKYGNQKPKYKDKRL